MVFCLLFWIYAMCECVFSLIFFFFKQKTAYELRISDGSSDVCSSDLLRIVEFLQGDVDDAQIPALDYAFQTLQIGRASCRERVVSVRVDLGGRRIIKKKRHKYLPISKSTYEHHKFTTTKHTCIIIYTH